ncbi:MAG: flavodoxin family protein [Bacteroidetes bacterium]|nr:flavodoxin family protein [Bacteroidota bacterium]
MATKILAFNASPRRNGNSTALLESFLAGAVEAGAETETIDTEKADIISCRGCLRCNLLKRCIIRKDGWQELSGKILDADVLVFATPIYFHHTTASCKRILDRFRSFIHVQITETGLIHTPHQPWSKKFILLAALGSSSSEDAEPLIDLFGFMKEALGEQNSFVSLIGTRLAVGGQVTYTEEQLADLYPKLELPVRLAAGDAKKNSELLRDSYLLGRGCGADPGENSN